jgi:putative membrane protein
MKNILKLMFIAAAFIALSCNDDNDTKQPQSNPDELFAINAAMANHAEIELGALAREHGDNQAVREYGTQMETDHTASLSELQSIADGKNIKLSDKLDSAHTALKQKLMMLSGMEFDTTYLNNMIKDHEKVIAEFDTESRNGQDQDLVAYATKTLPHLNEHLTKAQEVKATVKGQVAANAGRKPE